MTNLMKQRDALRDLVPNAYKRSSNGLPKQRSN